MLPLLLLDIDGVLCPYDEFAGGEEIIVDAEYLWIRPELRKEMAQLAEVFELVWASGREEKSNLVAEALLMQPLPHISFYINLRPGVTAKLADIQRFLADRKEQAVAWIDDEFEQDTFQWASQRSAPTLVVHTQSSVGLTPEHFHQLMNFAAENRSSVQDA